MRVEVYALLGFLALFVLAITDYVFQPQLWDADEYINIARQFAEKGYATALSDSRRSIGYPTLLYPLALISAPLPITAVLIQGVLYAAASLWLAREISARNELLGVAALVGLLLNPINIWLLNTTLTEAPTLIVFVGLTALLLRSESSRCPGWLLIFGTGIAAYAAQIRPANSGLFVAWCCAAGFLLIRRKNVPRIRKGASTVAATTIALIASLPQLVYNVRHFGVYSIFPAGGLWEFQVANGIHFAKYGSSADPSKYGKLFYVNPLYAGDELPSPAVLWYLQNPWEGLGTLALHTFNAFSFDYHSVYVYDLTPPLPWLFPFLMWIVVLTGIATLINFRNRIPISPTVIFLAVSVLGVVALNSLVAVENRFNLVPMTLLTAAAAYGLIRMAVLPRVLRATYAIGVVAASALLTVGTQLMKKTIA